SCTSRAASRSSCRMTVIDTAKTSRSSPKPRGAKGDVLLEIRGLRIEGQSDEKWTEIVKGIDLTLRRGEVLRLIRQTRAGKSTLGLAAMAYARPGCRISAGTIMFDGQDLARASHAERRRVWGAKIAYVAQSAAASFNPAHRLIEQYAEMPLIHGVSAPEQ